MVVAGARPNFMKVAPIIRALDRRSDRLQATLVHTGQHYDAAMSDVFFGDLGLREPEENLGVGSGTHAWQTAQVMMRFEPVLERVRPAWVLVVGDVNSTAACALVSVKLNVRVGHVEAGLRSFDRSMPEEINRLVTDAVSDLLFTPSADADENLRHEGVAEEKIKLVGNVMIDTLLVSLERARARAVHEAIGVPRQGFVYVTLHRPGNVDDGSGLSAIVEALRRIASRVPVVFPVHPRTRQRLQQFGFLDVLETTPSVRLLEPIGYHDSLSLTDAAAVVLTDSGGLQEESAFLRVPCLTLRPNTERPITISHGSNRLTTVERMEDDVRAALARSRDRENTPVPPLWDGHAAERIVETLLDVTDHRE